MSEINLQFSIKLTNDNANKVADIIKELAGLDQLNGPAPNEQIDLDYCAEPGCDQKLSDKVKKFCQNNQDRFGGKNYCTQCQKKYK